MSNQTKATSAELVANTLMGYLSDNTITSVYGQIGAINEYSVQTWRNELVSAGYRDIAKLPVKDVAAGIKLALSHLAAAKEDFLKTREAMGPSLIITCVFSDLAGLVGGYLLTSACTLAHPFIPYVGWMEMSDVTLEYLSMTAEEAKAAQKVLEGLRDSKGEACFEMDWKPTNEGVFLSIRLNVEVLHRMVVEKGAKRQ